MLNTIYISILVCALSIAFCQLLDSKNKYEVQANAAELLKMLGIYVSSLLIMN